MPAERTSERRISRREFGTLLIVTGTTTALGAAIDWTSLVGNNDSAIAAKLRIDELHTRLGKSTQDGTIAQQPLVTQDQWPQVQRDYARITQGRDLSIETVKAVLEPLVTAAGILITIIGAKRFRHP